MKTLSSFNDTKVDSPHVSPVLLFEIYLSGITLYFCDRIFGSGSTRNVFDSQVWEPIVLECDDIKSGNVKTSGKVPEPSTGSILVDNTVPVGGASSFTALFSSNTVFYQNIKIYKIYEGASATADKILLVDSEIEDIEMERETVRLYYTSSDVTLNKKFTSVFCELDTYPGAEPDDVGKMLPIVYGNAKKVPFIGVDTGTLDTLSGDINSSVTSLSVSDAAGFPLAGGTVQIDSEQITYSYRSGNLLNGCTRGANGTTAVAHEKGAIVAEVQAAYIYVIGHAVKSIDNVYVEHRSSGEFILQSGNYTAYTGQTGDEHPSYPSKAVIQFNTLPTIEKQVNLEIEDTIEVLDTIDLDDPSHRHGGTPEVGVWYDIPWQTGGTVFYPERVCDGSLSESTYLASQGAYVECRKIMNLPTGGNMYSMEMWAHIYFLDANCNVKLTFSLSAGGEMVNYSKTWDSTGFKVHPSGAAMLDVSDFSMNDIRQSTLTVERGGGNPYGNALVTEVWVVIRLAPDNSLTNVSKTGAAEKQGTVTLSGNSTADTVIGGRVCADVKGYQADASGNYGTTGALIERPDYIFKHFLVNHCGWLISDFGSTYTDAASNFNLNNIVLAPVLLDRPNVMEFLSKMAFQCHSIQFFDEGDHQLIFLADDDTANNTIEQARIDAHSVKVRYTPRAEIVNRYTASYNKEWVQAGRSDIEDEKSVLQVDDAASQGVYGVLEGDVVDLDFIRSEAQAQSLLEWLLEDNALPRLVIDFEGGDFLEAHQKGDIIDFTFDNGSELDKEFLGLVVSDTTKFRVVEINRASSGKKYIEARQSSLTVTGEYDVYLDNTRWEPDQLNAVTSSSWDSGNTRWNFNIHANANGGKIVAIGTWANAIRPAKIKITHDHGGTPSLTIRATNGIVYQTSAYTSGTEITPNWANRIGIESIQLEVSAGDDSVFHVSNIELWSQAPSVTQTTSTTTSTVSTTSSTASTASTTTTGSTTSSTSSTASTTHSTTTSTKTSSTVTTTGSTYSTTSSTASTSSTNTTSSTASTTSSTSSTASTSSSASTTSTASTTSSSSSTVTTVTTGPPCAYSNGDIFEDHFKSVAGWVDNDSGTGVSQQALFDGLHTLSLYQANNNGQAERYRDLASYTADRCVVTVKLYIDTMGSTAGEIEGVFVRFTGIDDDSDKWTLNARWRSDGLFIYNGSSWIEVGTDEVTLDQWDEWTFDCRNLADITTAVVDVYLNEALIDSNVSLQDNNSDGDGRLRMRIDTWATANVQAYFDYIRLGTGCDDEGFTTTTTTSTTTTTTS